MSIKPVLWMSMDVVGSSRINLLFDGIIVWSLGGNMAKSDEPVLWMLLVVLELIYFLMESLFGRRLYAAGSVLFYCSEV